LGAGILFWSYIYVTRQAKNLRMNKLKLPWLWSYYGRVGTHFVGQDITWSACVSHEKVMLTNASIYDDYMTQSVLGAVSLRTSELFFDINSQLFKLVMTNYSRVAFFLLFNDVWAISMCLCCLVAHLTSLETCYCCLANTAGPWCDE